MADLADNLDMNSYCEEISRITGIDIRLVKRIIIYAIKTNNGKWYDSFEFIINNILASRSDELETEDIHLLAAV